MKALRIYAENQILYQLKTSEKAYPTHITKGLGMSVFSSDGKAYLSNDRIHLSLDKDNEYRNSSGYLIHCVKMLYDFHRKAQSVMERNREKK